MASEQYQPAFLPVNKQLVNLYELAALCGWSPRTLRSWRDRGMVVAVRQGRAVRYDWRKTLELLARRSTWTSGV